MQRISGFLLLCIIFLSFAPAQDATSAEDKRGTLSKGNVYNNPVLGLTINLPGSWQLKQRGAAHGASSEGCTGPLCGDPDIDVAIGNDDRTRKLDLYLAAWKLSAEYRNRNRYPLKWFAQIMTTGSLGGSNWVPLGSLTEIRIDGRSAYRLLVRVPDAKEAQAAGYVSESNGYVFLLVGHAASSTDEPALQTSVEAMVFPKSPH